jgi:hypothetical protein
MQLTKEAWMRFDALWRPFADVFLGQESIAPRLSVLVQYLPPKEEPAMREKIMKGPSSRKRKFHGEPSTIRPKTLSFPLDLVQWGSLSSPFMHRRCIYAHLM